MLEYDELGIESRDHFTEQDVGMLFRPPVECLSLIQGQLTKRMKSTNQFSDVTKHILGVYEFTSGDVTEEVIVMNVHLRSRPEGESIRRKQARLLQTWIAPYVREGKNVIVLGDFNTEVKGDVMRKESDIGIAAGLETDDPSDDLVDLHLRIPSAERGTHLLEGRQFDRILCSRSLIEDDPSRKDLVFEKAEVLRKLTIQGQKDTEEEHWESYWKLPADQRDLSDHCPVMATFRMR
jgi:endonuclease/exonuclease/phosphatase family metal-dependent hydrolase